MKKIGLGTVQFGLNYGVANKNGKVPFGEAKKIVEGAIEAGIDTFDTAISYGDSEQVLGTIGVQDLKVVTKLPDLPDGISDVAGWVENQVSQSVVKLGANAVYAVLLHRSENLLGSNGDQIAKSLNWLKTQGLVQKVGVSIYDPAELMRVINKIDLDIVQAPLNLVDRRLVDSGWLDRLFSEGIEVHTRSAFLQGLLLMSRKQIPPYFERWSSLWDNWQRALREGHVNPVEACLSYPLSLASVSRVVVGVDSVAQFNTILQAAEAAHFSDAWSFMCSSDEDLINPARWG